MRILATILLCLPVLGFAGHEFPPSEKTRDEYFQILSLETCRPSPAWEIRLKTRDGESVSSDDFLGRPRLCLFFREPLHRLAPHLASLTGLPASLAILAITDQDLNVLALPPRVEKASNQASIGFYSDFSAEAFRLYRIARTPAWLVIDPRGKIIAQANGFRDWQKAAGLFELLAKSEETSSTNRQTGSSDGRPGAPNSMLDLLRTADNQSLFYH